MRKIIDPATRITSDDVDACRDSARLTEMKMQIEAQIIDAELQVNTAKGKAAADGDYMDPVKYNKLISYRRVLGFLHQKILFREREFKSLKKAAQPDDSFSRIFMQCAKTILPPEKYGEILAKTRELSPE